MVLSFLHISDLHFESKKSSNFEELKDKIIQTIVDDEKKIDFIVFSGDLIQKPLDDEFQKAYNTFLKPIMDYLSLDNDSFHLEYII